MHPGIQTFYDNADRRMLASAISIPEGQLISSIVRERDIFSTIEIGCANGLSSMFICDALSRKPSVSHVIIDPFQSSYYRGRGIAKLRESGFHFFQLVEEPSEIALPALLRSGAQFDFGLIDGNHTFEHALVDFFYVYRLINVGGVIAFDDVNAEPVKKVVRYACNYPNLSVIGSVPYGGVRRRLLNFSLKAAAAGLWPIRKALGARGYSLFADPVMRPERIQPIECSSMIALLKTAPDTRNEEWYVPF